MHPIHPIVVHFPIALLTVSVFFDLAAVRWRPESFREASFYTLILGLIGGIIAVITGAMAEELVEKAGVPENVLDLHEGLGYATLALFGALLVIRLAMRWVWVREAPAVTLIVGIVGILILSSAGYYGGSLGYDFGAGVSVSLMKGVP